MDECKLEDNIIADSSNRHPIHSRKSTATPQLPVLSRYFMIGIGILVLLLIVIGIGAILKEPKKHETALKEMQNSLHKDINLYSDLAPTKSNPIIAGARDHLDDYGVKPAFQLKNDIKGFADNLPTQVVPVPVPLPLQSEAQNAGGKTVTESKTQVQLKTPGDPEAAINFVKKNKSIHALHGNSQQQHQAHDKTDNINNKMLKIENYRDQSSTPANFVKTEIEMGRDLKTILAQEYTLQLSSASRAVTLHAYAKQQNIKNYLVHSTIRNGKPWYVLVSGKYTSPASAKRAIMTLPMDVQAKKPWVRIAYKS